MQQQTNRKLQKWRQEKVIRKVKRLQKLAHRRSLKRRAKVELMKLVTTLNQQ